MGRKMVAESFGTFALVFAGTGAIVVNDTRGRAVTHVGIALTFGLVVLAMDAENGRHFIGNLPVFGERLTG